MATSRMPRIEEMIKEELALIILENLTDPRIGFATISHVKVSKDLRHAIVGVSVLSDDPQEIAETLQTLTHAKSFIRRALSGRVNMKYLPDLKFIHDGSTAYALHIQKVLNGIEITDDEEEGAEAGSEDDTEV